MGQFNRQCPGILHSKSSLRTASPYTPLAQRQMPHTLQAYPLLRVGLLELSPGRYVPLHLQPHRKETHHDTNEMPEASQSNPTVSNKHQMTKFPEAIKVVCHPAFRHHWPAIVIASRPIIDTANSRNTPSTMT